ncbi:MAG: UDP-N-acetylmuramate dehydrogenase [Chromatiaceae bacterium]|nr:UDP-N-acetylmuramate dehydrogenase [Gammaproteobacteria bacterium]MCP5298348.1 UDP-N-acetylmuramate dehydrogenase [Chromatiaceae bacterium]MCP5423112.1 UDP-N-acetylmuramate dehydrogenase [Chromatiaceae bacterium]
MMTAPVQSQLRGELRRDEPLTRYNTWRVGGHARQMYLPADIEDLAGFLVTLPANEPLLWLGLGSNLLIRDGGFAGTVILLQKSVNTIEVRRDRVWVEAGAACAKVARECARAGLTGAAFLAGIPGTMGGALAMNAGAFGGATWPIVEAVTTIDRHGVTRKRTPADFIVAYREVRGAVDEWFVDCTLRLEHGDVAAEQAAIRSLLDRRAATQPTGQPSCGSTFRNPPGDHAARLIEASGLKGYRVGGAEVSPKHANFIINTGSATADDIEALIAHVRDEVERQHGVRLQTEVHMVGERA